MDSEVIQEVGVGSTTHINNRWSRIKRVISFDKIFWITVGECSLADVEKAVVLFVVE